MSNHPYKTLPPHKFWKNLPNGPNLELIGALWKPKFPINKEMKIITAGSCFAQHISKHLIQAGFNWLDSEPAPDQLTIEQKNDGGYGIFSFRCGNIYTPDLLKQWINLSLGKEASPTEVFFDGERYFDPLRPNIPVNGYGSQSAMLDARSHTLKSIHTSICKADLLIFTLGLTEAWRNCNGYIYPVCPGTIKGHFLPELHVYHNFTYTEIVNSLTEVFNSIRAINPKIRLLLTVSPVPLTATASNQHILTATTYSKSILRAAAGFLADTLDDVDYFPSYELITSPIFGARFFQKNLRSITAEGVQFVMRHFLSSIESAEANPVQELQSQNSSNSNISMPKNTDQEICEDAMLEQWSEQSPRELTSQTKIMLVGDSNLGRLAKAFTESGIEYAGGAIMNGPAWDHKWFERDPKTFFVPIQGQDQIRWWEALSRTREARNGEINQKLTIVSNIGAYNIFTVRKLLGHLQNQTPNSLPKQINLEVLRRLILSERSALLQLVRQFIESGHQVLWLTDPPVEESHHALYTALDDILCEFFEATGAKVFNMRRLFSQNGLWSSDLAILANGERDFSHANPKYYKIALDSFLRNHLDI